MRIFIGTSGFSYKEWRGPFYPEKMKPEEYLGFYANKLSAVELNNTFYRLPSAKLLSGWASQVPDGFTFTLKATQRITHQLKLKGVDEVLEIFIKNARVLGEKLGAVDVQLPPYFRKDAMTLRNFLSLWPKDVRAAFEFRHASWFDDEIFGILREDGAALCLAESDESKADEDLNAPLIATANWGYLRLRRTDYTDTELVAWAARLRAQPWERAYVFLKHEDAGKGPQFAMKLRAVLDAAVT